MYYMGYLTYSIILNIVLCGTYIYIKWTDYHANNVNWTKKAAEEAEEVASFSCSGHGVAYLDSSIVHGKPVCECYACYTGSDCSHLSFPCLADADSGNPLFLEPFWKKQRENSSVLVSGWHRLGYSYPVGGQMSVELEKYIFKLHELVGNAVTKGRRIVFGTGSAQLLNAAVHSLASFSPLIPAPVLVSVPYYPLYESQTKYFATRNYEFKGDVSHWKNKSDGERMSIEFVTSPNNPDCKLNQKVLQGPLAKAIHDHVYYWPHYTAIPAPADEHIMLFSVSKLTGHAGSRFGWALVKDESVHRKMNDYVNYNSIGVSHDTQLRILELLKVVVDNGGGRQLFQFGHQTMKDRWERLNAVFSKSTRFSLQVIPPQFCTYYQQVRQPSPAYAWLKCERKEEEDCYAVLKSAGIIGRKGCLFGAEDRYVRLSLLKTKDDFELLILNLQQLIKTELEIYAGNVSSDSDNTTGFL
ncbi:tryptophan aminotransferase-related protein 3-like [Silene latifolia]|uniref:tryptophan aminotransferase-related protein 3-like n=1 Tax=Silene latifolia TaxID=37657 RepID=UPI003D76B1F1